jgi:short-subunit dehydrogenase
MMTNNGTRWVVVTGSSSGIGYCLAHGLHDRGYGVIATCRQEEDVVRLREEGLQSLVLDLASETSVNEAADGIRELTRGKVFALVNNGAYGQPGALVDIGRGALRQQFETNVFGTQQLTNALLPLMLARGTGRVIQISSILGFVCLRFRGAYNASKYALEALTDTMRLEHRGSGIYFSLVEPGPIRSRFRQNALRKYREHIDRESSIFRHIYAELETRLHQVDDVRFTLPPEAVLKAVIHALESPRPRIRYPVTLPTRVMAVCKRLFPDRFMDWFLDRQSDRATANDAAINEPSRQP